MQPQSLKINCPDPAQQGAILSNANRVFEYLNRHGWEVSRATVNRHVKAGFIPQDITGAFPLSGVQEYARRQLAKAEPSWPPTGGPASVPTQTSSAPAPQIELDNLQQPTAQADQNEGLEAALARLRRAELLAYTRWESSIADGNAPEAVFRSYGQAVELLRKAEKNLLDLQRERRELLPAEEVRAWLLRQIVAAKATLLNLPGKLAPQLEGQPWQKIQVRLEEEIIDALGKLAGDPEQPVEPSMDASGPAESLAVGRE